MSGPEPIVELLSEASNLKRRQEQHLMRADGYPPGAEVNPTTSRSSADLG
jgi:hypothetical protein